MRPKGPANGALAGNWAVAGPLVKWLVHGARCAEYFACLARNRFADLAVAVRPVRRFGADADLDRLISARACLVTQLDCRSRLFVLRCASQIVADVGVGHQTRR